MSEHEDMTDEAAEAAASDAARSQGRAILFLSAAIACGYATVYILFRWLLGTEYSFTENVFVVLYLLLALGLCIHCARRFAKLAKYRRREERPPQTD